MTDLERLTRDNFALSRPNEPANDAICAAAEFSAINCTDIDARITELVENSLSRNSRRAYRSDLAAFEAWGGTIPATPKLLAAYLASHADSLAIATLTRRLATISRAHNAAGYPNPVNSQLVRAAMKGVRRTEMRPTKMAKPLMAAQLQALVSTLDGTLRSRRDGALLLLGFAGGFRRSELVGLDVSDLYRADEGILVKLRRSKTDGMGHGRRVAIPFKSGALCPIVALDRWLSASNIIEGPVFRPISRHGRLAATNLTGEAVALILRRRLLAAGVDTTSYSGHSLRSGFVTSAAVAGVPMWKIRAQTGHTSDYMVTRYIREGELFSKVETQSAA